MPNPTPTDTTDDLEESIPSNRGNNSATSDQLTAKQIEQIKAKSVSGVFSYFLKTLFLQGIGLASALILSIFFSPEDFGVYGYVTQIIGLLIFFSDIGLAATLVQKKNEPNLKEYRTAFTIQQGLAWFIVLICLFIVQAGFVQGKLGVEGEWILLALAISFPLASLKTISSIKLERNLEFSKLVLPQIFEQLIFHGLLISLAYRGFGAMAYTWAILARSVIGVVVMFVIQPWPVGLAFSQKAAKELVSFGAKFQLNDFLARIKDQLFYLFLGQWLPLRQFGYVQWAKTWSMYPYNLTVQNVMAITFPTFSRLQQYKNLLKKALDKSIFFISLLIFPLITGMSCFIYPLTVAIPAYAKWQPAVPSFILFTLSIGWAAISTPLINSLNALGKINQSLKLMILWTILTWVLTPLLINQFGYHGVALAAFVISFTSGMTIKLVKQVVSISIWPNVYRQLFAALAMSLVSVLGLSYWSRSLSWLFMGGALASLTYTGVFLFLGKNKLFNELSSLRQ